MSHPRTIYRGVFENAQSTYDTNAPDGQMVIVTISDMDTLVADDVDQTVNTLDLTDNPIRISVIDNDEDKFTPIRAKQCEIGIYSTGAIDISTFASGGDKRWKVEVTLNYTDRYVFIGWLNLSLLSMEFQPHPNVIVLTATDGLGSLKDVPLTDFSSLNPTGKNKICDYIAWCLSKTGLNLTLFVVNNLREENNPAVHIYNCVYLDAKTFEKDFGVSEDCYTVLQKILGEYCFLCQTKGRWYIQSIDEKGPFSYMRAEYTSLGIFLNEVGPVDYPKSIGIANDLSWFGYPDSAPLVVPERAYKSIKETYNYTPPKEIVCNMDFSRGDFIANLSDEVVDSQTYTVKSYAVECWTYYKGVPVTTQDSSSYIKRLFNSNGYESERYLHMPATATSAFYYQKTDGKFSIHFKDKFSFGLSFKHSTDLGGGSGSVTLTQAWIRLYGDDGTYWNLHADSTGSSYWVQATATWTTNQAFIQWIGLSENADFTKWQDLSIESPAAPVSGDIEVLLVNNQTPNSQSKSFASVSLEYIPFINGSYQKYTGQYHKVSQTLDTVAAREREVFISDSPKKLFKGALFRYTGSAYVLAGNFTNPNTLTTKPYGEHQAFTVWNQYNRVMMKFDGRVDRLQTDLLDANFFTNVPDLISCFLFTDESNITTDGVSVFKHFQLLHFEQDYNLCAWDGVFVENYSTANGKVYTDEHIFKYSS